MQWQVTTWNIPYIICVRSSYHRLTWLALNSLNVSQYSFMVKTGHNHPEHSDVELIAFSSLASLTVISKLPAGFHLLVTASRYNLYQPQGISDVNNSCTLHYTTINCLLPSSPRSLFSSRLLFFASQFSITIQREGKCTNPFIEFPIKAQDLGPGWITYGMGPVPIHLGLTLVNQDPWPINPPI